MKTLHLICGKVGAGKSTFSKHLENQICAVRFTHDDWMTSLYGVNPPEEMFQEYFNRVSNLIWTTSKKIFNLGHDVILDNGFWTRASRDEIRFMANEIGVSTKFYFVNCPDEVRIRRVEKRTQELPSGALYIDAEALKKFDSLFEPFSSDEVYALIDGESTAFRIDVS